VVGDAVVGAVTTCSVASAQQRTRQRVHRPCARYRCRRADENDPGHGVSWPN